MSNDPEQGNPANAEVDPETEHSDPAPTKKTAPAADSPSPVALRYNSRKKLVYPGLPARDLTVDEVKAWVGTRDEWEAILTTEVYTATDDAPRLPAAPKREG